MRLAHGFAVGLDGRQGGGYGSPNAPTTGPGPGLPGAGRDRAGRVVAPGTSRRTVMSA